MWRAATAVASVRETGAAGRHRGEPAREALSQTLNRKCIPEGEPTDSRDIEKTSPIDDASRDLSEPEGQSRGSARAIGEPSDADLERGILDAVRAGLTDVARVLAAQLEARQKARVPANVVDLGARRRK